MPASAPGPPGNGTAAFHESPGRGDSGTGVLSGGMLPKIRSSVAALEAGTSEVQMIDGRVPHSLLLEIFTDKGIGTEIVKG